MFHITCYTSGSIIRKRIQKSVKHGSNADPKHFCTEEIYLINLKKSSFTVSTRPDMTKNSLRGCISRCSLKSTKSTTLVGKIHPELQYFFLANCVLISEPGRRAVSGPGPTWPQLCTTPQFSPPPPPAFFKVTFWCCISSRAQPIQQLHSFVKQNSLSPDENVRIVKW